MTYYVIAKELKRMTVLRLFISFKYITTNVVGRNNARIVAMASTVEHSIKKSLECSQSCNAKAATILGEVLAMRLKVEGLSKNRRKVFVIDRELTTETWAQQALQEVHVDVNKEVDKKASRTKPRS
ncbi:hypothetical protein GQ457_12G029870 [Hibiscus cannabinus]